MQYGSSHPLPMPGQRDEQRGAGAGHRALAVITMFELPNRELGSEAYRLVRMSGSGGPIACYSGATVDSRKFREARYDTLLSWARFSCRPRPDG